MLFKDIPGLQELKDQLISAADQNQVAHAQLFAGQPGCPNLAMAIAFATYLNCENRQPDGPCGRCAPCSKSLKHIHPDIHFVFPVCGTKTVVSKDARSRVFLKEWRQFIIANPYGTVEEWTEAFGGQDKQAFISVEESREVIRDLSLMAFEENYKIEIIWLPELMRKEGANALLKILEEPPGRTVFLLVSNHPDSLLSTITSRMQYVFVRKFSDNEIKLYLTEKLGLDEVQAAQLSNLADGDLHNALFLSQNIEDDTHDWFREWMRLCFAKDLGQLVQFADEFHAMNKVARKSVLQYGINMLRESLVTMAADSLCRLEGEEKKFVQKFSKILSENKIIMIYEKINTSIYHLERNANAKIKFLNLSVSISRIFNN